MTPTSTSASPDSPRLGLDAACAKAGALLRALAGREGGSVMAVHPGPSGDSAACAGVARAAFLSACAKAGLRPAKLSDAAGAGSLSGRALEISYAFDFAPQTQPGPDGTYPPKVVAAFRELAATPGLAAAESAGPSLVFARLSGFDALPASEAALAARSAKAFASALSVPGRPCVVCLSGDGTEGLVHPKTRVLAEATPECVAKACRTHGCWGEACARSVLESPERAMESPFTAWTAAARAAKARADGLPPAALRDEADELMDEIAALVGEESARDVFEKVQAIFANPSPSRVSVSEHAAGSAASA